MKKYKVIICYDMWSHKKLAKKTEDAINTYCLDGWELDSVQHQYWGSSIMIVLKKTID